MSKSHIPRATGVASLVVSLSVAAFAARQQPPQYVERVEVSRILIDARVVDDHGQPIRDLDVDDFTVRIGGKAARLESVEWIAGQSGDEASLDATELRGAVVPSPGRLIVFVVQKSLDRDRIRGLVRMLAETGALVDVLGPRDRVAVVSFDSRLHIWLDFTNDLAQIRQALERVLFETPRAVQQGPPPSLIASLAPEDARRIYSIERALRRIGEALAVLPGAKSVVLVGHGFGRLNRDWTVSMENEYEEMSEILQSARASVFCLDVTQADYHSLEAGLQLVAADTGGFFARTYLFPQQAIDRLAGALVGHYVLFVEGLGLEPGTHRIELKLTGRRGRILARNTWDGATPPAKP